MTEIHVKEFDLLRTAGVVITENEKKTAFNLPNELVKIFKINMNRFL